jgi:hypothetical protein
MFMRYGRLRRIWLRAEDHCANLVMCHWRYGYGMKPNSKNLWRFLCCGPSRTIWLCAMVRLCTVGECGEFGYTYAMGLWASGFGHPARFSYVLWAAIGHTVAQDSFAMGDCGEFSYAPWVLWARNEVVQWKSNEFCTVGRRARFGYALWAIAQDSVMHHRPLRQNCLCAMGAIGTELKSYKKICDDFCGVGVWATGHDFVLRYGP